MPVDIGGIAAYGVLYVAGIIAFLIAIAVSLSNKPYTAATLFLLLVAYIVLPGKYFRSERAKLEARNKQIHQAKEDRQKRDEAVFARYCKDGKRIVFDTVKPMKPVSVFVRFANTFPGSSGDFNAGQIAIAATKARLGCDRLGVKQIVGQYDRKFVPGTGYQSEFRRYQLCGPPTGEVVPEPSSEYELVLGEVSSRVKVPGGSGHTNSMAKSSARIVDKRTGKVLAEDTMYFLGNDSGVAGCTAAMDTLTTLVQSVFGDSKPAGAPANATVLQYDR